MGNEISRCLAFNESGGRTPEELRDHLKQFIGEGWKLIEDEDDYTDSDVIFEFINGDGDTVYLQYDEDENYYTLCLDEKDENGDDVAFETASDDTVDGCVRSMVEYLYKNMEKGNGKKWRYVYDALSQFI